MPDMQDFGACRARMSSLLQSQKGNQIAEAVVEAAAQ